MKRTKRITGTLGRRVAKALIKRRLRIVRSTRSRAVSREERDR